MNHSYIKYFCYQLSENLNNSKILYLVLDINKIVSY